MLILAREEIVAALLGLMVELQGLQPRFPDGSETVGDAIRRAQPAVLLVDCDHVDCTDALLEAMRRTEAIPILFSPFRMKAEVQAVATRHGIQSFTLPTDSDSFRKLLEV